MKPNDNTIYDFVYDTIDDLVGADLSGDHWKAIWTMDVKQLDVLERCIRVALASTIDD